MSDVKMLAFATLLAVWGLAAGAHAQPAPDYVLVSPAAGPPPGPPPRESVVYWDRAQIVRNGDEIEVEVRFVSPGLGVTRPRSSSGRYRISCEWGAHSFRYRSENGAEVWTAPRFINANFLDSVSSQVCGFVPAPQDIPRFSTNDAVYADAVERLGFESLEAAMQLPEAVPYVTSGGYYTAAPTGDARERYDLVYGPDADDRAVFLKRPGPAGGDGNGEGSSIWLMGVGGPRNDRSYAIRAFRADCAARGIAVASVRSWPITGGDPRPAPQPLAELSSLAPAEGGASAALLAAACSPPADGVVAGSVNEVVAFTDYPTEDPAFAILSQQTVSHDDMRWVRTPDAQAVTAAYPQGALHPGETGLTTVACVVTREYALTACRPSYHWPNDRGLAEAHMTLIGQYAPARASATGGDTMGRRVEFSIRWSPEGSAPQSQRLRPGDATRRRTPSRS